MKVKENHRRMAIVSEVLTLLGSATSKDLTGKTNMTRLKVQQTLAELKRKGYATSGDKTGTGNEAVWISIKPFVIQSDKEIDWRMYHYVFHNLVSLRNTI